LLEAVYKQAWYFNGPHVQLGGASGGKRHVCPAEQCAYGLQEGHNGKLNSNFGGNPYVES
jgi:hypothetical protein